MSQSWPPKRSPVCWWEPGLASLAWPQSWPGLRLASTQILAWPQKLAWPQIWPLTFCWPHFFVFRIVIYWSWFNWYIISILHLYINIFVFDLLASDFFFFRFNNEIVWRIGHGDVLYTYTLKHFAHYYLDLLKSLCFLICFFSSVKFFVLFFNINLV